MAHADRLLQMNGGGTFEPWVERLAEFSAFAHPELPQTYHRLLTDDAGHFQGIATPARDPAAAGLAPEEVTALDAALRAVRGTLTANGYSGPFGIDAYRYRTPDGSVHFRALSDLNARYTFGST